ncbi:MAG: Gfo/Idh/MocA family oxidoreductase [bacterium]
MVHLEKGTMTLRWGLIGSGDIARKRVAPALRDLASCDLVAVCRGRPELAEAFAREFGARRWYATPEELLADDEIDAVYLATPVHLHAAHAIAAAHAGKHVLCEKPMAMNVKECDEMIAACAANGVALGVAYYLHFYPAVLKIKALIASGELGKLVMSQINVFEFRNPSPDDPRHWFIVGAQAGGGPMFDFGCHRLEMFLNMCGPVRDVTSMMGNVVFDRDVEDTGVAVLRFESGAYATLSVTHAAVEPKDTLDMFFTEGSVHVDPLNDGLVRIRRGHEESVEALPPAPNFHLPLIEEFVEAVNAGRVPAVPGETGRRVASIEEKIYMTYVR